LEVNDFASAQIGTSASLQSGSLISIKDILRGLMLPSGNDAAMVLAENFGLLIALRNIKKKRKGLSDEKDFENCVL
jgi:D-alanyl-D-alanine carboxypeptidase